MALARLLGPKAAAFWPVARVLLPTATALKAFAPTCAPLPIAMPFVAVVSTKAALPAPAWAFPPMAIEFAAFAPAAAPMPVA